MKRTILFAAIAGLLVSCVRDIDVKEGQTEQGKDEVINQFDFSTVQDVNLSVDYSAFNAPAPVLFSVYSENPFTGSEESMTLRSDISPIFEAYTGKDGKFNDAVKLPAYAKQLYVVTGNFFVTDNLITVDVKNGTASAVAQNYAAQAANRAPRRAGEATNSLDNLYQLSYEVNVTTGDKTDKQIYKEWNTPLGTWDSESGHPNYLMDKATADSRLLFTEEETQGLYETVTNALSANQACNPEYLSPADLVLVKDSEVALSFLGSTTCWNNTLGYYYYTEDNKPTSPMDINVIMLFPNTQDGHWSRSWMPEPNFYGNIALDRGDVVQLMYYPNIASGSTEGATKTFPKGTRIGFLLKSNGWGMQKTTPDGKKYFNSYNGGKNRKEMKLARQYNVWCASTDGLSYCNTEGLDQVDNPLNNPEGLSRTAKFAYESPEGKEYAIVGFEDACNDTDYDDVIIALKPADVFQELPKIEEKKASTTGVYAFEDLWPSQGDYDLNDALVEATHEKVFSVKSGSTTKYKILKETFYLTTYQNYVELKSGLAVTLNTNVNQGNINIKKVDPATKDTTKYENFTKEGNTYLLTDDITGELGTTYILELVYKTGIEPSNIASIQPFIYRTEGEGRWEVHIPFEAPTSKMITGYFGTFDDKSVPAEGKYYVRNSNYPFAFYLEGVSIDTFKETLLLRKNESVKISDLYPSFLPWVKSNGEEHADWYLHPSR